MTELLVFAIAYIVIGAVTLGAGVIYTKDQPGREDIIFFGGLWPLAWLVILAVLWFQLCQYALERLRK